MGALFSSSKKLAPGASLPSVRKVELQYGLDEHGLELICDEAISVFRSMIEPNDFWMSDIDRKRNSEAHDKAITQATQKILAELGAK